MMRDFPIYYVSLVEYYTVYKLKRMDREAVQLYLLCSIHDRYQRLNDNLLGAFCSLVRRYADEVDAATKEAIYRFKLQTSEDVEQGAKVLALFLDPGIDGQPPFATVRDQAHSLAARRTTSCAAPSLTLTVAVSAPAPSTSRKSGTSAPGWSATRWSTTTP